MALRSVVVLPHRALMTRAEEIANITEDIVALAEDMAETMYRAPGIGLAANQVAKPIRLIVVDVQYGSADPKEKKKQPIFVINPVITLTEGECTFEEGCLSVPDFRVEIRRPKIVRVEGVDLDGSPLAIEADGLLARALQHEIDHLEATTILDYASVLRRNLYRKKLRKMAGRGD